MSPSAVAAPAASCVEETPLLDGVWEDAPNYGGVLKKMYIVRASPCGSRITVDVYDLKQPSRWLFGGAHLMRRNRTGTSLLWGAQGVNKYKSDVRTAVESGTICWYRCGDSTGQLLPSWVWRRHQGHQGHHQSVVRSSRTAPSPNYWWTSCSPQDDLFAMSEYDPDEWWPARFVCVLHEEGADPMQGSIVVSTQDGAYTWTVPLIGGAVKASSSHMASAMGLTTYLRHVLARAERAEEELRQMQRKKRSPPTLEGNYECPVCLEAFRHKKQRVLRPECVQLNACRHLLHEHCMLNLMLNRCKEGRDVHGVMAIAMRERVPCPKCRQGDLRDFEYVEQVRDVLPMGAFVLPDRLQSEFEGDLAERCGLITMLRRPPLGAGTTTTTMPHL